MYPLSKVAPEWWDYTTLDRDILDAAAKITIDDLPKLQRKGFKINIFETLQEFYAAEALEYVKCWQQATAANPAGICGPIGPTEQLPIVAQIVNDLNINLKNCHFWAIPPVSGTWIFWWKTALSSVKTIAIKLRSKDITSFSSELAFVHLKGDDRSRHAPDCRRGRAVRTKADGRFRAERSFLKATRSNPRAA